jgi:hypothetical protein
MRKWRDVIRDAWSFLSRCLRRPACPLRAILSSLSHAEERVSVQVSAAASSISPTRAPVMGSPQLQTTSSSFRCLASRLVCAELASRLRAARLRERLREVADARGSARSRRHRSDSHALETWRGSRRRARRCLGDESRSAISCRAGRTHFVRRSDFMKPMISDKILRDA